MRPLQNTEFMMKVTEITIEMQKKSIILSAFFQKHLHVHESKQLRCYKA